MPPVTHPLIDAAAARLKAGVLASGLTIALVSAAWASASTFRGSRSAWRHNGARIRLPPKDWEVNQPTQLAKVLAALGAFSVTSTRRQLTDVIVLAGTVGVGAVTPVSAGAGCRSRQTAAGATRRDRRIPPGAGAAGRWLQLS